MVIVNMSKAYLGDCDYKEAGMRKATINDIVNYCNSESIDINWLYGRYATDRRRSTRTREMEMDVLCWSNGLYVQSNVVY